MAEAQTITPVLVPHGYSDPWASAPAKPRGQALKQISPTVPPLPMIRETDQRSYSYKSTLLIYLQTYPLG